MKQVTLNGSWSMNQRGEDVIYKASVPGSVLSALLDAKAIPDPYDRMNEYPVRDLFRNDFIFQREFEISGDFLKEEQAELVCEGLDTLTDIFINDRKVFHADNMHRTWRIPVKESLMEGKNTIRVEFLSVLKYIEEYSYEENKEITYTACGAMKGNQLVRKAHSMFGWDWGPQLPDAGIFRNIGLESWTGRRILETKFHQEHEKDAVKLQVNVRFSQACRGQERQKFRVTLKEKETGNIVAEKEEILGESREWEGVFEVLNPRLWWPNGYGEQPLYELSAVLFNEDGSAAQEEKKTIGLRTLTVSRERDCWGREFAFQVNGVKIFAMGANYIPEDCVYSRITKERQEYLLDCAVRAHFNCVRVWGGGYYPSDTFYELCDEKGLIVWQDLMFACNVYDATDAFLESCAHEIEDNVKRLRHHPSLGLWCGNNEIESAWNNWAEFQNESGNLRADYIKLFEYVVPSVLKKHDPDTFFWPSSPSSGGCFVSPDDENDGDAHYWDVWHGQKPFTDYRKYFFRFCSEFGFQSFPAMKTVESFTEPEDRNIFSRVMESHQKNGSANGKILYYLSENFRYPAKLEDLIYVSQVLQGSAIQYGVEHWRRHRGRCMGTLYWQLNDNWPVASWSSVDYFGRWKALQYMACRFYAPLAASLVKEDGRVSLFVENETGNKRSWKAKIYLKNMDCQVLLETKAQGSTGAFASEKAAEMELEAFLREADDRRMERVFVESEVFFEDGTRARNVETLLPYKYLALRKPSIAVSVEETEDAFVIRLKSPVFAPFVELDFADADVIFSDNYFYLTGDSCEIQVKKSDIQNGSFADAKDLEKRLHIRSIADTYE